MKKQFLTGLMAMTLCSGAVASEVVGYTNATSGEAATAAAVNANFNALITAINDNAQRIAALEDQAEGIDTAAGTYNFVEIAVELAGTPGSGLFDGYSQIGTFSGTGSFSFAEDGSFSGIINETSSILFDDRLCDNAGTEQEQCRQAYQPDFSQAATETLAGTWTEDNNGATVTFADGGTVTFAKAGPRLMVLQDGDVEGTDVLFDFKNLVLLVKQLN